MLLPTHASREKGSTLTWEHLGCIPLRRLDQVEKAVQEEEEAEEDVLLNYV